MMEVILDCGDGWLYRTYTAQYWHHPTGRMIFPYDDPELVPWECRAFVARWVRAKSEVAAA